MSDKPYSDNPHAIYMRKYYRSSAARRKQHYESVKRWKAETHPQRLEKIVERRVAIAVAKVRQMLPTEAAYLAGLVDSDGGIYATWVVNKQNGSAHAKSAIYVTNTNGLMPEWVMAKTGVGSIVVSKRSSPKRHGLRPIFRWSLGNRSAMYIAEQIKPYLVLKTKQAELLIELAKIKLRSTKLTYVNQVERQRSIVTEIQELNRTSGKTGARQLIVDPRSGC